MKFTSELLNTLFAGLTSDQKFYLILAMLFSILIYVCTAMITKTSLKFLGIELKPKDYNIKKDNENG